MEIGFFSSTIVQVALSTVISWALFALLCSMVHEIIVQLKSERGRFFRSKIFEKLFDSSNNINWGLLLYNHSSIKLLTKSEKSPPTEINSKTLAEALIDIVANAQATKILKNDSQFQSSEFHNETLKKIEFATTNLGQSDIIIMLRNALSKAKLKNQGSEGVNESQIYLSLIEDVKIWFDQFGDRTTAWYKKISQKRLFIVGLLIALAINIDSLTLFEYYRGNPTTRAGILDFYTKNKLQLEIVNAKYDGTIKDSTSINSETIKVNKEEIIKLGKQIDSLKTSIDLPIGWDKAVCINSNNKESKNTQLNEFTFSCIIYKLIGILISAFAASLGAPFWFDVLKKATTVTVTKKTEGHEQ